MELTVRRNQEGFMTELCKEIMQRAGEEINEVDVGGEILSSNSNSAKFWSRFGDRITGDVIVKMSVEDDLQGLSNAYWDCQRNATDKFGVFDLITTISPSTILDSLISVGERRSRLGKEILKSEGSTRIISGPPVETDLIWLIDKWRDTIYVRWVAFPWKNKAKVLMVGSHINGDNCFTETMVAKYSNAVFPLHMVECFSRDMCWQHSDTQSVSAFVVDHIDNVPDVIAFIDGCELAASYINEINTIDWGERRHYPAEKLEKCRESDNDIYAIMLKRALKDFIEVYSELMKHPICTNKGALDCILCGFADYSMAKLITEMPLEELEALAK